MNINIDEIFEKLEDEEYVKGRLKRKNWKKSMVFKGKNIIFLGEFGIPKRSKMLEGGSITKRTYDILFSDDQKTLLNDATNSDSPWLIAEVMGANIKDNAGNRFKILNKDVNYVVIGRNVHERLLDECDKLNIPIISEHEFLLNVGLYSLSDKYDKTSPNKKAVEFINVIKSLAEKGDLEDRIKLIDAYWENKEKFGDDWEGEF